MEIDPTRPDVNPGRAVDEEAVLVAAPPTDPAGIDFCSGILDRAIAHEGNALIVSLARSLSDVDDTCDVANHSAASVGIIDVTTEASIKATPSGADVTDVAPGDVERLGIEIVRTVESWSDDGPSVACLGSVAALLDDVDVETAFRFLHATRSVLAETGVSVHAHADPAKLSDETVALLGEVFEGVVRPDDTENRRSPTDGTTPTELPESATNG